jgi:hypothetical protein
MNTNRIIAGCCAALLSLSSHGSADFKGRAPVKGAPAPTPSPAPQTGPADSNPATGNDSGSSKPPQTNTDGKIPGSSSSDTQPVLKPPESVTQGDSGASPTNPISPPSPQPAPTPQPFPSAGSNQGPDLSNYCSAPPEGTPYAKAYSNHYKYPLDWCQCVKKYALFALGIEAPFDPKLQDPSIVNQFDETFLNNAQPKLHSECDELINYKPNPDSNLQISPAGAVYLQHTCETSSFSSQEDSEGTGCCDLCYTALIDYKKEFPADYLQSNRWVLQADPCYTGKPDYFPVRSNGSCHDCKGCFVGKTTPNYWYPPIVPIGGPFEEEW